MIVRQGPELKIERAEHNPGVGYIGTGILKSGHLPHCLFLEISTPDDYLPDEFTVLYLHVRGLCFSLNEEHEGTCRATEGKIYVVCKWIFLLYNSNKPTIGSSMGVGNLLETWWRRSPKDVFGSA